MDITRVVISEIAGGKFLKIYSNLFGNMLITCVNQLFPSPALQSDVLDKRLSRSLVFNFVRYVQKE